MKKQLSFIISLFMSAGVANAQFANNGPTIYLLPIGGTPGTLDFSPNGLATSKAWVSPGSEAFLPNPFPVGAYKSSVVMTQGATTSGAFSVDNEGKIYMTNANTAHVIKTNFYDIQGATGVAKISYELDFSEYTGASFLTFGFGNSNAPAGTDVATNRLINANHIWTNQPIDVFTAFRFARNSDKLARIDFKNGLGTQDNNRTANTHVKFGNNELGVDPSSQILDVYVNSTSEPVNYTAVGSTGPVVTVLEPFSAHIWGESGRFGTLVCKQSSSSYASPTINAFTIQFDGGANIVQERVGIKNVSITYDVSTTPVSLTSFDAIKKQGGVELKWNTASESNNSHFDILRSTDGVSFTSIATIKGVGTTQEVTNYTYVDNNPVTGTNYYKLKQVDNDGTEKIYDDKVKAVKFGLGADDVVVTLSGSQLSLNAGTIKNTGSVELISISGQKVFSKKVQFAGSSLSYDLGNLAKGVYIARVTVGGEVKTTKLAN